MTTSNAVLTLNAIRNQMSDEYQRRIPEAVQGKIQDVGNALLAWEYGRNEFLNVLINKIGMTLVDSARGENLLKRFRSGTLSYGDSIEEIFVHMAKGVEFDRDKAETEVFKRVKPDIDVIYHKVNYEMSWKVTVELGQLNRAFTSENAFSSLVAYIVQSIYEGAEHDEFVQTKEMFTHAVENGQAVVMYGVSKPTNLETSKAWVKSVKTVSKGMKFNSDLYNHQGVMQKTPVNKQILIINKDVSIEVSTELLASAFNKGEFDYNTQVVELDNLGSDETIIAALVDEEWFRIYDTFRSSGSIYNPQGAYWNYNLIQMSLYSYSLFKNAVFFSTAPTPVEPPVSG